MMLVMRYRSLGDSGLVVSVVGLGCNNFGGRLDIDRTRAVVRAAIGLAHELNIEIVAEGVETEGQEKFLLSAGCDYGQGYRFSRPVSAAQATALLRLGTIKPKRKSLRLVESSAA